jgi:hypothetical protein
MLELVLRKASSLILSSKLLSCSLVSILKSPEAAVLEPFSEISSVTLKRKFLLSIESPSTEAFR